MKRRFILYRRKLGGMFYVEDTETRKQESLGTKNRAEATSLLNARNESVRQPQLNLQIAKAYLAGTDSGVSTRTWQQALDAIVETKSGSTQDRWRRAAKETALDFIRHRIILETQGIWGGKRKNALAGMLIVSPARTTDFLPRKGGFDFSFENGK